MKKVLIASFLILGFGTVAHAQVNLMPPDSLMPILEAISAFPVVGPIIVLILKYLSFVGMFFTVVSTAFIGASRLLQTTFNLVGAGLLADSVEKIEAVVAPWLKFLSMYNVKHPLPGLSTESVPAPKA